MDTPQLTPAETSQSNRSHMEILELEEMRLRLNNASPEYIDVSNKLARLLFRIDPEQAVSIADQSIALARSIDHLPGLAKAYTALSHAQLSMSRYTAARHSANKAIQLFIHLGENLGLLDANNALGISYDTSGEYEKALEIFLRNEEIARELGETRMQGKSLNNIACILFDQGNYSGALEYFMRAYECTQELQDPEETGIALLNIGVIHLELGHLDEALEYLTHSLECISSIPEAVSGVQLNLSQYHKKARNTEKALEFGIRCLEGYRRINNPHGIIGSLRNLGEIYLQQKELDKACYYFEEALKLARDKNEKTLQAENQLLLGRAHVRKAQPDTAIRMLKKVFRFEKNYKSCVYEAHQELALAYEQKEDYQSALKHHKEYARIKNLLFNQQSDQKMQSLRIIFQLEQAEREARLLKQKNEELAQTNKTLAQLAEQQKR
ncbi:tetratricopeptide repeat protein [Thiolapillus sp.]